MALNVHSWMLYHTGCMIQLDEAECFCEVLNVSECLLDSSRGIHLGSNSLMMVDGRVSVAGI